MKEKKKSKHTESDVLSGMGVSEGLSVTLLLF